MHVVDGFLQDFESLRTIADDLDYAGVRNPVDGVVYPGISTAIPDSVKQEIVCRTSTILGAGVSPAALFMRLSLKGVPVPHQAHTDSTMGQWSLMLYLNRTQHCEGGTALLRHSSTGLDSDPQDQIQERIWKTDTNRPDKWTVTQMAAMRPNRAFIFPSYRMHRAEPVGGFGDNKKNGRLVLTMFFNVERDHDYPLRDGRRS